MRAVSIADYRALAQRRLPHFLFEYIDGGAYDEITLNRNVTDLKAVELRQRVLRDVSRLDTAVTLFGQTHSLPVALGPIGLAGMNARRGEAAAARAAESAGAPFCLSTVSVCSIEEVRAATTQPFWFQLYMMRDRGVLRDLLARALAAGCTTLVVTVDLPVAGVRYRDHRSGLAATPGIARAARRLGQALLKPGWVYDVGLRGRPHSLGNVAAALAGEKAKLNDFFGWLADNFDPSVTWANLERLRADWPGALIIKGVLDVEDAQAAARLGADGVVVSNHGGRQLDGVPSTARALPPIAEAVGDRLCVLADGGVRSGLDVARMLALGADSVLLGRAWAYALAGGGQAGVAHVLDLIGQELRVAMALTGCTTVAQLDRSALANLA